MKPVLYNIHWLPVKKRIVFKILLIAFKVVHDQAPSYFKDLNNVYQRARSLRSSSKNLLSVPSKCNTKFYDERAFCYAALVLWILPSVNHFKCLIKTHLFNDALLFLP